MTTQTGKVRWVGEIKEFQGVLQVGFQLEGDKRFFNHADTQEALEQLVKTFLPIGTSISYKYDAETKKTSEFQVLVNAPKETGFGSKKEKSGNWADDIVNFETLLRAAHKKDPLFSIKTELLQVDWEKKQALFKAIVTSGDKTQEFYGHGDSTQENIDSTAIKKHFIRMAETRAIVRALRWFTNIAECSEEEK